MTPISRRTNLLPLLPLLHLVACGDGGAPSWSGTVDTLPSGMIVVNNPPEGTWTSENAWRVTEVTRIGTVDGDGPDLFGSIDAIEIDATGRLWVLDGQAQEIRVFNGDGTYVRTIGRKGGGPGEFNQAIGMAWDPTGRLWVVDPQNTRVSVIDTAGRFVTSHRMLGGFVFQPWPGRFDGHGYFYNFVPDFTGGAFRLNLVRYDTTMTPLDTLRTPEWQGPENFFEVVTGNGRGRMRTTVPYSEGLQWRLAVTGDFWFLHTGPYELYYRTADGDTLLKVTKPFDPVPVTSADRDSAVARLRWFTRQGGQVDASRIPDVRPAANTFFLGDDGTVWVLPVVADADAPGPPLDVFDGEGRYLGRVSLPFSLSTSPYPIVRNGRLVAVSQDELGVESVVLARIENYAVPELRDTRRRPLGTD